MREQWGSKTGFILAAAGSAVGLGNIWRFPNMVAEGGGGAFLFIYLIVAFTIGFSILLAEVGLGRLSQSNAYAAFNKHKQGMGRLWGIIGAIGLLSAFIIGSYYFVIAGWSLSFSWQYLVNIFNSDYTPDFLGTIFGYTFAEDGTATKATMLGWMSPLFWGGVFLLVCYVIIVGGIKKGLEIANKVLMPALILIILFMAIYVLFILDTGGKGNQWDGVRYYLKPDFSKINIRVVSLAISQAFFSLSVGYTLLLTYGSYLKKDVDLGSAGRTIVFADTGIAFLAGLITLPIVFAFSMQNPDGTVSAGAGLVFMTLPQVFAELPMFLGLIFFFLITIAALTSYISIVQPLVAWLTETFNMKRAVASTLTFVAAFIVGIYVSLGMGGFKALNLSEGLFRFKPVWNPGSRGVEGGSLDVLDTFDTFVNNVTIPLGALGLTLFVAWVVWDKMSKEIQAGSNLSDGFLIAYRFFLGLVCPVFLVAVLAFGLM